MGARRPFEVAVVVRRDEQDPRYLVLLRAPEKHGYWHLVAGGVGWDEEPAVAAQRELEEETGLRADVVQLDLDVGYALAGEPADVRDAFPAGTERVEVAWFLARAPSGWEPVLDAEHVDYRWCDADAAVDLLFWPEPKEALRVAHASSGVAS